MTNISMLAICLLAGMLLRLTRRVPDNAYLTINGFIINVALPALILAQIHGLRLTTNLLWPVSMPWLLFMLSAVIFTILARIMRLPRSTAGITIACPFSSGTASRRGITLRIIGFPPPVEYPAWVAGMLHRLGDTLALVSVGLQLRLDQLRGHRVLLGLGLGFKLVLGPLLLALLYVGLLAHSGETTQVTLFESAMGPQIGGAIVAMQYGLNPTLITLMVGIGIVLSFLTLPLWYLAMAAV